MAGGLRGKWMTAGWRRCPHAKVASMGEWIEHRVGVLGGKPVIRGTRISVDFLLELFASGATREQIFEAYPQVSEEALAAALRYAARAVKGDVGWEVEAPA